MIYRVTGLPVYSRGDVGGREGAGSMKYRLVNSHALPGVAAAQVPGLHLKCMNGALKAGPLDYRERCQLGCQKTVLPTAVAIAF